MTRSLRRKIFVVFLGIFLFGGIGLIYYTQGYRIDFATLSVHKTGGVYIETSAHPVSLSLNGKIYQDTSGFLQRGTFLRTIFPKRYRLVITKDGYRPYEKNISVAPGEVTPVLNVLLVPQTISATTTNHIPGNTIIAAANGMLITRDDKKNIYYKTRADTVPPTTTILSSAISALTHRPIIAIAPYPQEKNRFVVETIAGLFSVDVSQRTQEPILTSTKILWWNMQGGNLSIINMPIASTTTSTSVTTTAITIFDLSLAKTAWTQTLSIPENTSIVAADTSQTNAALILNTGSLLLCAIANGTCSPVADSVKMASFSADGTRLFYQDRDGKIFVYLLNDDIIALNAPRGSTLRIGLSETARIQKLWWAFDNYHLLCAYPDKISIAEVTKGEPNEQFNVADTTGNVWYDNDSKMLFSLADGILTSYNLNF